MFRDISGYFGKPLLRKQQKKLTISPTPRSYRLSQGYHMYVITLRKDGVAQARSNDQQRPPDQRTRPTTRDVSGCLAPPYIGWGSSSRCVCSKSTTNQLKSKN